MNPEKLPIYQHRERIIRAVNENNVIVVESPTGSGKTTQIPLILHNSEILNNGVIGITQPRRIAAISVCEYMARQINSSVSGTVGYKIRFSDATGPETKLKIMTDGILLQELKTDRLLSKYSLIMVDEAHERSLNIDFILGLLKQVLKERPDFKVIISSATINAEIFSQYFDGCPILHIDARVYPIQTKYFQLPASDNSEVLIQTISDIVFKHLTNKNNPEAATDGDMLIFLPGERLIQDCAKELAYRDKKRALMILPLFGRLPKEDQEKVFIPTPKNKRKIVISTNIAETSVTIDKIKFVIDSGLAKVNYYNQHTYTSSLIEKPISKASCNQRRGRAGRTSPGICYRLYSKEDYNRREMFTEEEIQRTDLSEVVLRMSELGITDFQDFDFITNPGFEGLSSAIETLKLLHAIDNENVLTSIGEMMVKFPLLPRLSRMIVESIVKYHDVLEETIIAAAFLSARAPYILPPGEEIEARHAHHHFSTPNGDFFSYVTLYRKYTAIIQDKKKYSFCKTYYLERQTMDELVNIVQQLSEMVSDMGIPITSGGSAQDFLCAIATGLVQFVCVRSGKNVYRSLTADKIHIHPGSVLFRKSPQFIVAGEIVRTSRTFARSVSPIKQSWLRSIHSDLPEKLNPDISSRKRVQTAENKDKKRIQNTVEILRKNYPVETAKGNKKVAVIPYQDLVVAYDQLRKRLRQYRNLRVKITYQDFWFHKGDRFPSVLRAIPYLKPESGIIDSPPAGIFDPLQESAILVDNLNLLLCFCKIKQNSKNLGFITLDTDKHGNFRFKCVKNFHTAVETALYSIEILADSVEKLKNTEIEKKLNVVFRSLNTMYEL